MTTIHHYLLIVKRAVQFFRDENTLFYYDETLTEGTLGAKLARFRLLPITTNASSYFIVKIK